MSRSSRDRYLGVTLGDRFRVTRPLADGGMSRVYVARDEQTGDRVAVKILVPRPGPKHDRMIERMRREAIALERLDHPNIVKTLTHGPTDDGGFYIAMELIEGPSITGFIKANRTEPEGSVQLLLQVCSALRHAHRKGIVHRDLKSSNLLVSNDERGRARVKLIDFGIVKLADEDSLSGKRQIIGSVHTIAPEQVKGEEVDLRADIYAVGILAYRLIAGEYPYHSRVPAETITQHVHAAIPVLDDTSLPDGLPAIVARCMAKDPADRYPNVQELMDELSDVLDVPTAAFTRPVFPKALSLPPTAIGGKENRRHLALLAGGVLVAAAALLWILVR